MATVVGSTRIDGKEYPNALETPRVVVRRGREMVDGRLVGCCRQNLGEQGGMTKIESTGCRELLTRRSSAKNLSACGRGLGAESGQQGVECFGPVGCGPFGALFSNRVLHANPVHSA